MSCKSFAKVQSKIVKYLQDYHNKILVLGAKKENNYSNLRDFTGEMELTKNEGIIKKIRVMSKVPIFKSRIVERLQ